MSNLSVLNFSEVPCRQSFVKINEYMDGELSSLEEQSMELHLSNCSACARELESLKNLKKVCSQLKQTPMPDAVKFRLRARLKKEGFGAVA